MLKRICQTAVLLICMSGFSLAGVIRYDLNTDTTNGDTAVLLQGFFETDGTVGTGLRLSDILTDYSITISELNRIETLNPTNSLVTESLSLFDVTPGQIVLPAGPGSFKGLGIRTTATADADKWVRYAAVQTSGSANAFVSINSGAGTLNGDPTSVLIATAAVPEPSAAVLFASMGMIGLIKRRRRRTYR